MPKIVDVIEASETYADILNGSSFTRHVERVVPKKVGCRPVRVVRYAYLGAGGLRHEVPPHMNMAWTRWPGGKRLNMGNNNKSVITAMAKTYRAKCVPAAIGRGITCGMIGFPDDVLAEFDNDDAEGDHFVAYVYVGSTGTMYYFDSAISSSYKSDASYRILCEALAPVHAVANTGVYEYAAGKSNDDYSFVAQNIFCHSWCLRFLREVLHTRCNDVLATIDAIDADYMRNRANTYNTGRDGNRKNLIMIKKYICETLIPVLGLGQEFEDALDTFKHIVVKRSGCRRAMRILD